MTGTLQKQTSQENFPKESYSSEILDALDRVLGMH